MIADTERERASMELEVRHASVGSAALEVPPGPLAYTQGTYGEMWQWRGNGHSLFSLILVHRSDGEVSSARLTRRLRAEVDRVRGHLVNTSMDNPWSPRGHAVPGASVAVTSYVDGTWEGIPLHNSVTMAADADRFYMVHVAAADTLAGRQLAASISSSLRLVR